MLCVNCFVDKYDEKAFFLHQYNPVVDAHLDLAAEIYERYQGGEREVIKNHYLENFKKAGITFIVSSVFIPTKQLPARGFELTLMQISALLKDIETIKEEVILVQSKMDMQMVISEHKIGIILYLEGLDIITNDCSILRALYAMGVRGASLTWSRRNYLGEGCCRADKLEDIRGGLSKLGIQTLQMLEQLNMFVDVSHLNDDGFEDVLMWTKKPFIATHSNARNVHMSYRNLTDNQIQALAKRGGVIGLNAYKSIVGVHSINNPIHKMCDHIQYIIRLVGENHIGFGLDLCDSYERALPRREFEIEPMDCLKNHAELILISAQLLREGCSEDTVKKVIGGNFVEYFMKFVSI
ncbi:membrane dipeptidase [Lachnotalea glycerini]|nr:membrane dipeptidase [Lachnotalea glycerini]